VHRPALRRRQSEAVHRLGKLFPVFGDPDGPRVRADQLHVELLERAVLLQRHRHVERSLTAHGGQQGVGPLSLDHPRHPFRSDRLDVGPVGQLRIGHDGGRIRVHQDHPVTLFLERPHRLGARIVELGALPDDDRAGADEEDRREVSAFRHVSDS
jgi:hypothetical protein